jgi:hypothetical protein
MEPARTNLLGLAGHRTPDTPTLADTGYALSSVFHNENQRFFLIC